MDNRHIIVADFSNSLADYTKNLYCNVDSSWDIRLITGVFFGRSAEGSKPNKIIRKLASFLIFHIQILSYSFMSPKKVLVHWQWVPAYSFAFLTNLILKFIGCKIIYTAHNTNPYHGARGAVLKKIGYKFFLSQCDHVIVHNDYSRMKLSNMTKNLILIPHGLISFDDNMSDENFYRRVKKNRITFFGQLSNYKGLDRISGHLKSLLVAYPYFQFTIVGRIRDLDAKHLQIFANLSENYSNFHFQPQFVQKSVLHQIICESRVLLQTYHDIDDSGVTSAGINYLVPSIVSDIDAFKHKGITSCNSFIMDNYDYNSWEAVFNEVSNENILNSKINNLRNLKSMVPTWKQIQRRTFDLYEDL